MSKEVHGLSFSAIQTHCMQEQQEQLQTMLQ